MVSEIKCKNKAEWLVKRREFGIGASESSVALGENPWNSPFALYQDKLGLLPPIEESPAMEWGSALEAPIRAKCKKEFGVAITNPGKYVIQRNERIPHLFATLDGIVPEVTAPIAELFERHRMPIPQGPGVLEIKTTNAYSGDEWDLEWPLHYQIQVQHEMIVSELEWGICAALIGGQDFRMFPAQRATAFEQVLVENTLEFWEHVQKQIPPPVDGSAATAEAIRAIFPEGSVIDLPEEAIDWDQQYCDAVADMKAAEASRQLAWNWLTSQIGSHTYGRLPSGIVYSWKSQTTKAHEVKASTSRVLRRNVKS